MRGTSPVLVAIPARHGASRFPGKPLAPILGRPLVAWVVDVALEVRTADDVAVVTDHEGIAVAAREAGARAVVLERPARSGTDRVGHLLEADREASGAGIVVNLQGDEPLVEPELLDRTVEILAERSDADIATLARPLRPGEDPADANLVKVALAEDGRALWFSRAPIPHGGPVRVHVGLYAFRRSAFDRFVAAEPTALERTERLEQLRALEHGLTIACEVHATESIGIDEPGDVEPVEAILRARVC